MTFLLRNWHILALGLLSIVGAGLFAAQELRVRGLQRERDNLSSELSRVNDAFKEQSGTVEAQGRALEEWRLVREKDLEELQRLRENQRASQAETRRLVELFSRHDLGRLVNEKPGLVNRLVNDGTARTLRMFECASGAVGEDCPGGNSDPELSETSSTTSD